MPRIELNHFESYEWTGLFWFPESRDKQFSGKITYSPEIGIQVEIVTTSSLSEKGKDRTIARKLMHGIVDGVSVCHLTLINIRLSSFTIKHADPPIRTFKGVASFLLQDIFDLDALSFDVVEFRYEKQFENIFFFRGKENALLAYNKGPKVTLDGGIEISMSKSSNATPVLSKDDLDTIFWSENDEKFQEFKNAFQNLIQEGIFEVYRRTTLFPTFKVTQPQSTIDDLLKIEEKWRTFWELLIDSRLFPTSIWLNVNRFGDTVDADGNPITIPYKESISILKNYYKPIKITEGDVSFHSLPINIGSFSGGPNDLSVVKSAMAYWFLILDDPKWHSVLYGVKAILSKTGYPDTDRYVALIAEIETLLELLDHKNKDLDFFIDTYASAKWKQQLSGALVKLKNDSLGSFLKGIRDVIAHPKAAGKAKGKYWDVAKDPILLQIPYAYLAGLFIQVILQQFDSLSAEAIEKYVDQFIQRRASWSKIEYL